MLLTRLPDQLSPEYNDASIDGLRSLPKNLYISLGSPFKLPAPISLESWSRLDLCYICAREYNSDMVKTYL